MIHHSSFFGKRKAKIRAWNLGLSCCLMVHGYNIYLRMDSTNRTAGFPNDIFSSGEIKKSQSYHQIDVIATF